MQLSEHEAILAAEIVHADQLSSQFEDVGGLEETIEQIQESVIYPLVYPQLFDSAAGLFSAPKGLRDTHLLLSHSVQCSSSDCMQVYFSMDPLDAARPS